MTMNMSFSPIRRQIAPLVSLLLILSCSHTAPKTTNPVEPSSSVSLTKGEPPENRSLALRELAYGEYLRGDLPKAIHYLETSLLLDPQPQESWPRYILYYCYLSVGDYARALSIAESLAKDHPYQSLTYQQVGLAHLWMGQTTPALNDFQRALDFEAHAPRLHFYLGLAYAQLGQEDNREKAFQDARGEYEQILKSNPKDFIANYELASLYLFWNKSIEKVAPLIANAKESIVPSENEDLPQEKKLYSSFYLPLIEGILQSRQGDAKGSLKTLLDLIPQVPSGIRADLSEIYFYIGKDFQMLNDLKTAKGFFERSVGIDPKGAYAFEGLKNTRAIASKVPATVNSKVSPTVEIGF
jgi:tetratricopeptide (TPR) repeat protein